MKKLMSIAMMIVLVGALAVTATYAQSADTLSVNIPFAFTVANRTFPAGDYSVRRSIQGATVVMELRDAGNKRIYLTTDAVQSRDIQPKSMLVFHRYGEQYFLSQVWIEGRSAGQALRKTGAERALQREFAKKQTKGETIAVATKHN